MLTPTQEQWIAHLSDTQTVSYYAFDSVVLTVYGKVAARVRATVGPDTRIELRGSAALGIGGQREIDIYLPVVPERFESMVTALEPEFGQPGSHYPLERVRFAWHEDDVKVELFVINETSDGWQNSLLFERYLASHVSALRAYEILKRKADGMSVREYYRRKLEFINEILEPV